MAWYAELKRRKWYCINGVDMIYIYKKKLYDDWYNSLTDEDKEAYEKYKQKKREEDFRKYKESLTQLLSLLGYVTDYF